MDINVAEMGRRIRSARKNKNVSAELLAEQIGLAVESLGHLECGARKPSLQTLYNIAIQLDVSMDYLLGRTSSTINSVVHDSALENELTPDQEKMLHELIQGMIPAIKSKV